MTSASGYQRAERTGAPPWLLRGARNGLVAGAVMAMVVMILGLTDQGLFAAPSSIWAFWAGPAGYHPRDLDISFVLGAMSHMMNSAVFGVVFAFLVTRILRPSGVLASAMAGVAFALAALALMWFVVLPIGANGEIVKGAAAGWIWIAGHVMFGGVGGLLSWRWR